MKTPRLLFLLTLLLSTTFAHAQQNTLQFSGYEWQVRPSENNGGPGPNHWDSNNAWVDKEGNLHLKLTQHDGKWYCAEVYTTKEFGFGTYQFWITGRVDKLDRNVVLGLFNYPESKLGGDGTHEMDIEFARWGKETANIGNYTVYPVKASLGQQTRDFPVTLQDNALTTQRFTWTSTSVFFQSLYGHRNDDTGLFHGWLYQPPESAKRISQGTMPVHINLWLFEGKPPSDGNPVEIVINAFKFTPR